MNSSGAKEEMWESGSKISSFDWYGTTSTYSVHGNPGRCSNTLQVCASGDFLGTFRENNPKGGREDWGPEQAS